MNKVVLAFPDAASMAEFILTEKITYAETNIAEHTLITVLTESQIEKACQQFDAVIKQISRLKNKS
ncbi:MAG: hypothetical protein ACJ75B_16855 [Flavisolibacter sp.]